MSYSMTLVPIYYVPRASASLNLGAHMTAASASRAAAAATASVGNSVNVTGTAGAAAAASTGTAASVSQSAAALTAASSAFAAIALPVAATILGIMAVGMAVEVIRQDQEMKKQNVMEIPTVFSSKERLLDALFAYDKKGECSIFDNPDSETITARYKLDDFIFHINPETGCYDLTIKNAGTCRQVLSQINALQDEYCNAVRQVVVARLYEKARSHGWIVESDTEDEEETRTISLVVS